MLTRRKFLIMLGLSGLGILFNDTFYKLAKAAKQLPQLYQLVTADMTTSRMIMGQSYTFFPDLAVEWRLTDSLDVHRQKFSVSELNQDNETIYYYHSLIEQLQPHSSYEYRLIDENAQNFSTWFKLTTSSPQADFTALLFSDSQCANSYDLWQSNLHQALVRHPNADWFADIGDLTDNGESSWHWQSFMNILANSAITVPLVPVMGNHECYGLDWKFCEPTRYLKTFVLPENAGASDSGYYYFFDYGAVRFFCLNSQMLELASSKPDLLANQLTWLHKNKTTHQKWQVVLMHKDVLAYDEYQASTQTTGGFSDVGRAFMPVFDEIGIDLVITGHMHTYRNRGHIKNFTPSSTGPLYIMSGPIGNEHYTVPNDPLDKIASVQPTPENYLWLQATAQQLIIKNYQYSGVVNDTVILNKD